MIKNGINKPEYLVIYNGTILTPDRQIKDGIIVVSGSKIQEVCKRGTIEEPEDSFRIDAGGNFITPGMIDIHVNGAMGADVTKVSTATFATMSNFFPQHGVSSYLATAITSTDEVFIEVLDFVRNMKLSDKSFGAELLGVHMEGPYISHGQSGAHPHSLIRLPKSKDYLKFLEYSDVLKKLTLAPELEGADRLVRDLKKRNIIAAAGHTDGIFREMKSAIDEGISHATHFFCNMSNFRRDKLMRVAGATETLLIDDRISGELIADGWHVDPLLMKLLVKVKGIEHVCFVTDAMPATGLPDGNYFIGNVEAVVENGIARLPDNSAYAGSVTTMDICLRNGMTLMELSLQDSLKMATSTPAEIIGISDRKGSLEKDKDADILVMDRNGKIKNTIIRGKLVYSG